jgi:hypothetical protein
MKYGRRHEKICDIEDVSVVNSLKANPTVSCSKCGAQAHDPASLCAPVQMSGSRSHGK